MAKKTEYVFIQGKTKWFRATTPNKFGAWSHDIYPNAESLEKLRALKQRGEESIKNVEKKDDDGVYYTFKRDQSKLMKGKVVGFAPPEVLDKEGKPLRDTLVGNGSDITTKLEMYYYKTPMGGKGSAVRWLSSRIDNLIPFIPQKESFTEIEQKAVSGLEEQPEQLF
jgi:hypothetical protein